MLGMQTSTEAAKAMREEFNLDRSLPEQYGAVDRQGRDRRSRPLDAAQRSGDHPDGRTPAGQPAARRARPCCSRSLVSIPLGVIAALRRNSWIDYLCTGYTVLGFAIPNFGLALILIYVFSIQLDWLPITGIGIAEQAEAGGLWTYISPFIIPADRARHPADGDADAPAALQHDRRAVAGLHAHRPRPRACCRRPTS